MFSLIIEAFSQRVNHYDGMMEKQSIRYQHNVENHLLSVIVTDRKHRGKQDNILDNKLRTVGYFVLFPTKFRGNQLYSLVRLEALEGESGLRRTRRKKHIFLGCMSGSARNPFVEVIAFLKFKVNFFSVPQSNY